MRYELICRNVLFVVLGVSAHAVTLPSAAQPSQAVFGKGYDMEQERFTGDCVTGTNSFAGASKSSIVFERSLSATEMSDSLGFAVGAKARYGLISGEAAASFAASSSSDDYSEATVYSAQYNFKNVKLNYTGLTPVGQKAHGDGQYAWENWATTCGHEFVEQIQLGARIMISAKIDFSTREDKQSFAASFKIKGPAFSVSTELNKASRRYGKTASVVIRAFQLGGDVSRLSAIFGVGTNAKVEVGGRTVHALLACSMDNIAACTQVLDNALTYATDTRDPGAFPNQIKPDYNPQSPNGPAELAYITKPWKDLAIYPPPPLIAAIVKTARDELSRHFELLLKLRARVVALTSGPFRLSPRQHGQLESVAGGLNEDLKTVMAVATVCYSNPGECPNQVANLKAQLKSDPSIVLDIHPEIFAQWCDSFLADVLKRSEKKTVEPLYNIGISELNLEKTTDVCGEAERELLEHREINLSGLKIRTLLPLASLPHIQTLYLSNNEIEYLSSLSGFSQLHILYVNGNKIESLEPLAQLSGLLTLSAQSNLIDSIPQHNSWKRLRFLDLGNNKLDDISAVSAFTDLHRVRLFENKISDVQPLIPLKKLKKLDLSHNVVVDFSVLKGLSELEEVILDGNPGFCPAELHSICGRLEF